MKNELIESSEVVCCYEDCEIQEPKPYSSLIKFFMGDTLPVLDKEITKDGQAWKYTCVLRTYDDDEDLTSDEYVKNAPTWINYFSTYDNSYIGDESTYKIMKKKKMIMIQSSVPNGATASIGYSLKDNKWYGWSHRAMYGFTLDDVVKEGDITATSGLVEEYRIQHPEEDYSLPVGFKALTMRDAKRMAIAFARAVS